MGAPASNLSLVAEDGSEGAVAAEQRVIGARRAARRRQMIDLIGVSYAIDAAILMLYACAGTIPVMIGPAYAACGLALATIFIALSETGFNDRFKDHYLTIHQASASVLLMQLFAYGVPDVGLMFLVTLFVVCGFCSLRANPRQNAMIWIIATAGLVALFLFTDRPPALPHGTPLERAATMLVFVSALGRCMFIGIFSVRLRQALYQRGQQLKEACKRIEELAELDELTGALNRRCIMRALDEEIARAARARTPLSIALIDLDWFKRINDSLGHPAGDEVLRTFSIALFANLRNIDKFGRYGGEEFLLVLPNTTRDEAAPLVERLRAIVSELDWSAFSTGMAVTISAGIATVAVEDSSDAILARADSALYAAKARGRNRVACA